MTRKKPIPEGAAAGGAASLSALGSAAALCCIGPWSVALFGVSGAIFLNRLEPFRPLILLTATVLLAWAFWRVYRPRPTCADATCEQRQAPFLKTALWTSAALLAVAFVASDLQWLLVRILSVGVPQ